MVDQRDPSWWQCSIRLSITGSQEQTGPSKIAIWRMCLAESIAEQEACTGCDSTGTSGLVRTSNGLDV